MRDTRADGCREIGRRRDQQKAQEVHIAERIRRQAVRAPAGDDRADRAGNGDDRAERACGADGAVTPTLKGTRVQQNQQIVLASQIPFPMP